MSTTDVEKKKKPRLLFSFVTYVTQTTEVRGYVFSADYCNVIFKKKILVILIRP